MEVVLLAIVGGSLALISWLRSRSRRTNESWEKAANRMGLRFEPGGLLSPRRLDGRIDGHLVKVDTYSRSSGSTSEKFTRYRVGYGRPLDVEVQLAHESMMTRVGRWFGSRDVMTGDAAFDKLVHVTGSDRERVQALLTPERRRLIQQVFSAVQGASANESGMEVLVRGTGHSGSEIEKQLRELVALAAAMEDEPQTTPQTTPEPTPEPRSGPMPEEMPEPKPEPKPEPAPVPTPEPTLESTSEAVRRPLFEIPIENASEPKLELGPEPELELEPAPELEPGPEPELEPGPEPELQPEPELEAYPRLSIEPEPTSEPEAEPTTQTEPEPAHDHALELAPEPEPSSVSEPKVAPMEAPVPVKDQDTDKRPDQDHDGGLDAVTVCHALFGPGVSSLDAPYVFADRFKGSNVSWSGRLEKVERSGFDIRLGTESFTRATFLVHELETGLLGGRDVRAMVKFPVEELDELRSHVGESVTFEGQMVDCDAFARTIYIFGQSTAR